ncbi:unnamed protein product [Chrysoparadoxa australica]
MMIALISEKKGVGEVAFVCRVDWFALSYADAGGGSEKTAEWTKDLVRMIEYIQSISPVPLTEEQCLYGGVTLLVLLVTGFLWATARKGAPPSAKLGLPFIGNALAFLDGPIVLIERCYKQYGPVFTVPVLGKNLTFLIGPESQAPFFRHPDEVLSQNEVYGFMKPVFGPGIVYDAPPEKRNQQMQAMANGLVKSARLKAYVAKIEAETRDYLANWGDEGEIDLLEELSQLTILTASRCLHGDDVREGVFKEVSELYHDLDKGITPLSFFLPNIPTKAHRVRNRARIAMCELFGKIIASRRADQKAGADTSDKFDVLQIFMDLTYKEGGKLTDDQITGLLIALLFAGQHTSSISSTWTTVFSCLDKDIMRRLMEEQTKVYADSEDGAVTWEKIGEMELLHNCMKEALRMHPPLIMLMRLAKKDFQVTANGGKDTYTVPKGDIVFTSPAVSMRLPEVFTNPNKFDPDRFARGEAKKPYSYLGFGGGMHQCMGQQFGFTQVKTILSILFREYEIEIVDGVVPEPDYTAMVVGPKGPIKARYRKRAKA